MIASALLLIIGLRGIGGVVVRPSWFLHRTLIPQYLDLSSGDNFFHFETKYPIALESKVSALSQTRKRQPRASLAALL
jgi:hypothetical protein